jgi:hypothetical protein
MKLSPALAMALANSGARQSDVRFRPERLAGPSNFHEVRACVSADAAQEMNSQVARLALSDSAALIGKPQFQMEVTRFPDDTELLAQIEAAKAAPAPGSDELEMLRSLGYVND